jgi:hypothetical protein
MNTTSESDDSSSSIDYEQNVKQRQLNSRKRSKKYRHIKKQFNTISNELETNTQNAESFNNQEIIQYLDESANLTFEREDEINEPGIMSNNSILIDETISGKKYSLNKKLIKNKLI